MNTKRILCLIAYLSASVALLAQPADLRKMSKFVEHIALDAEPGTVHKQGKQVRRQPIANDTRTLTAFVRIAKDNERVLEEHHCRELARFGSISIASIPIRELAALSTNKHVQRIEAGRSCTTLTDTTALCINAMPVYTGESLPQAYTGRGVVMGIQDIGFDLTHPNFFSSDLSEYRIKAFWDQLSTDTIGSTLAVGADYTSQKSLLAYAHSRDGENQTHGTHTLGIAAGSGYDSPYRGMAWESDICLVANATSENSELIDSLDLFKYTSATDALGFKYIFDYAERLGKPCVVSFSEGSHQDFYGDDQLLYEVLDSLTGPGRILVASAGNEGVRKTYFHKPQGTDSMGTFLICNGSYTYFLMRSNGPFTVRTVVYSSRPDTVLIKSEWPIAAADSEYVDTLQLSDGEYIFDIAGYPSCYNPEEQAYEMVIKGPHQLGVGTPLSLEIVGKEADVELFLNSGYMISNPSNPLLNAGESTHSIHVPSSAPSVISVGATTYRQGIVNYLGERKGESGSGGGKRADYSSVGPTLDGRNKPDVLAPGTNIISSYSSFYLENHPDAGDIAWDVAHFEHNGRTYAWNCNTGTSMATPVVGGAIALWLQAYPQLSPSQAMEVLQKTCRKSDPSASYPNNFDGNGEIDVYKGLLEVLRMQATNIDQLSDYQPRSVHFSLSGDVLQLRMDSPSAHPFTLLLYSVAGQLILQQAMPAGQTDYSVSLSGLSRGVYAVQLNSRDTSITGSTLIRR
ncbi:MAG: S8 family peptidase [Prevotella sp.]|nr:S8 family peptidase [Prevotella sp.]